MYERSKGRFIGLAVAAALVLGGDPASAVDLTGTWSGTTTCTSFFAGAKVKFSDAPTIQVTQSGDLIGLRADFGGGDVTIYTGRAIPDVKKPDEKSEIALIACGTDDIAGNDADFDEIGRLSAATKLGKVKATLKGLSFFSDPGVAVPEAGTCKWKLTRTDAVDADVSTACSAATLRREGAGRLHSRRHDGRN